MSDKGVGGYAYGSQNVSTTKKVFRPEAGIEENEDHGAQI